MSAMAGISIVIISYNEERNIARCIKSVLGIADEILVVDSYSTDRTEEICLGLGVDFYQHPFVGFRQQKNFALSLASYDYVLSLDADEALSKGLYHRILEIKKDLKYDGYFFNRRNNYCGQWIRYSNWYPDSKLRLFNRKIGYWGGINPHDKVVMKPGARIAYVKEDILHWVLSSYEEHLKKVNKFSSIAAEEYYSMGRKTTFASMLGHSFWRFCKAYFLRLGFLDGFNGFVISSLSAYTTFLKYIKLRQLNIAARKANGSKKKWTISPVPGNKGRLILSKERHLSDAN